MWKRLSCGWRRRSRSEVPVSRRWRRREALRSDQDKDRRSPPGPRAAREKGVVGEGSEPTPSVIETERGMRTMRCGRCAVAYLSDDLRVSEKNRCDRRGKINLNVTKSRPFHLTANPYSTPRATLRPRSTPRSTSRSTPTPRPTPTP